MHSCPDCGQACHCGVDIDDIDVGDEEAEENCTHCAEGTVPENDDDYEEFDLLDDFGDLDEDSEVSD